MDSRNGGVFAYEVLARLYGADGVVKPAGAFITTMERYGLAHKLDRAMVSQSLAARRDIVTPSPDRPKVFVNLSRGFGSVTL